MRQRRGIAEHCSARADRCVLVGANDTGYAQLGRITKQQRAHGFVIAAIDKDTVTIRIGIQLGIGQNAEAKFANILKVDFTRGEIDFLALQCAGKNTLYVLRRDHTEHVESEIRDFIVLVHHQHDLICVLRPLAPEQIVLLGVHIGNQGIIPSGKQLGPQIERFCILRHHVVNARITASLGGVVFESVTKIAGKIRAVLLFHIGIHTNVILVTNGGNQRAQLPFPRLFHVFDQKLTESRQVVGGRFSCKNRVEQRIHLRIGVDGALFVLLHLAVIGAARHGRQQRGHIGRFRLDGHRVGGQRITLYGIDVSANTCRHSENQRNADNTDAAGKRGQQRSRLFGHQILEGKHKRSRKGHRALTLFLCPLCALCRFLFAAAHALALLLRPCRARSLLRDAVCGILLRLRGVVGLGITDHTPIQKTHDSRGVGQSDLGVVRDHQDQLIMRNLLENLHDLNARGRIQGTCRLIREQDIRIVDQRTRDGNTLHLSARHLIGALMDLVTKSYLFERIDRAATALGTGYARKRQCQLYVRQNGLVWDQIIALKNKADGMIAIGIPVGVLVLLGRASIDDQITVAVVIQTAENVEQRRFSAAGRTQHGYKLIISERQRNVTQRRHRFPTSFVAHLIGLCNIL